MSLRDALDEVGMTAREFAVGIVALCVAIAFALSVARMGASILRAKNSATAAKTYYAVTTEHDGHLFVVVRWHGGILHHPDCKCQRSEK